MLQIWVGITEASRHETKDRRKGMQLLSLIDDFT